MYSGFAGLLDFVEKSANALLEEGEDEDARLRRRRVASTAIAELGFSDGVVRQPVDGPHFVKTGAGAFASSHPGRAEARQATLGAIIATSNRLGSPAMAYEGGMSIAALFEADLGAGEGKAVAIAGFEDDEHRRRGGTTRGLLNDEERRRGGGGGRAKPPLPSQTFSPATVASLAARAAGAQPTVIKVISTVHSRASAANLINYLGTRETEDGERKSIPILDQDGVAISNAEERSAVLAEWTERFRKSNLVSPVVSLSFEVPAGVDDEALHQALNDVFSERPFIYARSEERCAVYGISNLSATKLSRALAGRNGKGSHSAAFAEKAEGDFSAALRGRGVDAAVTIDGATATSKSAKYFLEKFVREHRQWSTSSGDQVRTGAFARAHARRIWASWDSQVKWENPRNAFHVVFSARTGTNPDGMVRAVRDFLSEQLPDHKWLTAHHPETGHIHVHAMIAARSVLGKPLRFTKPQLAEWRDLFAAKAREQGIDMVATRRSEVAASRPFTQGQVGAYERSKANPRYIVARRITERVEKKRAGVFEPSPLTIGNTALQTAWTRARAVLDVTAADPRSVRAAEQLSGLPAALPVSYQGGLKISSLFDQAQSSVALSGGQYVKSVELLTKEVFGSILPSLEFERKARKIDSNLDYAAKAADTDEHRALVEQIRHELHTNLDKRRRELSGIERDAVGAIKPSAAVSPSAHQANGVLKHEGERKPAGRQKANDRDEDFDR